MPSQSPQEGNYGLSSSWSTLEFGAPGTLLYRLLFLDAQFRAFSPWHEISLYAKSSATASTSYGFSNTLLNVICKTPRGLWAKLELAQEENFNPLRLCEKNNRPTHFAENSAWNIGVLPQTYADAKMQKADYGGLPYDGSQLEVFEIGGGRSDCNSSGHGSATEHSSTSSNQGDTHSAGHYSPAVRKIGDVFTVKPLAAFAVINALKPSISWKIIAVAADDPMVGELNDVADVHRKLPGALEDIREWLRVSDCVQPGAFVRASVRPDEKLGQVT